VKATKTPEVVTSGQSTKQAFLQCVSRDFGDFRIPRAALFEEEAFARPGEPGPALIGKEKEMLWSRRVTRKQKARSQHLLAPFNSNGDWVEPENDQSEAGSFQIAPLANLEIF